MWISSGIAKEAPQGHQLRVGEKQAQIPPMALWQCPWEEEKPTEIRVCRLTDIQSCKVVDEDFRLIRSNEWRQKYMELEKMQKLNI